MQDTRSPLPRGTRMEFLASGSIYEISGDPIGFGGGGIIYPARRMILEYGQLQADGMYYALKECYPASGTQDYFRCETGEVIAGSPEHRRDLENAKKRHAEEKERNQAIHVTANRMLPILETAHTVALIQPGKEPVLVSNAISIMESLENKGRSLSDCLAERRRFSALETCRILQQLLFSLREVHEAGYLHLDIQGGNVFLRGTLEDNSDFVTLIDFGSARPILEDGKTEEIRDRELFTSRGFSAPEMLLNNTGLLRLGREADLYSVGCIALYLLTGHRPNPNQLLANRSGKYLKPNQMRLVDCPAHLQERLQELLAKALQQNPEDRFHSADAMLREVNDLLEVLKPEKTTLSSVKYDAFICYKHGPVDSPVAKALQQRLEHFHTTDNGGKRIRPFRHVFLDEGELSACSDFGQLIRDALRNSRWLLVICSEDTPLSPWVKLEIETFLEIHGPAARSRILTLLTSGEPAVSLPPVLLEQDAGGAEPFAADVRGADLQRILKNLKGDAFLRLAAAMLDRPFDALKQRQKVYVLQRLAMVAGVFLLVTTAFAAYAVNRSNLIAAQAAQIRESYENALINESMLLAEQAEKQLKNNNPLEAIALARAALPSPEQERPVVMEAEYILGKALGIYISPSAAEGTMTAVGSIDTDDSSFFLDSEGSCLFTWESYSEGIRIWDAENLTLLRELLPRDSIYYTSEDLLIPELDSLLVRINGQLISLNYLTEEQNWSFALENILAVCLSEDRTRVVILSEQETESGEKTQYLDILSALDGTRLDQILFRMDSNQEPEMALVLSPDLKWAAVPSLDSDAEWDIMNPRNALYLINLENGSCRKLFDADAEILCMDFAEDRLAVIRGKGYTLTTKHGNAVYQYTEPFTVNIETYDPESGSLLWASGHRYYLRDDCVYRLESVPYDSGTASGKGLLACCSDLCVLLDRDSGQVVREYELPHSMLDIHCGSNGFETLNADGSSTATSYTLDTLLNNSYFPSPVSAARRHRNSYYIQSTPVFSKDYSIRKYELGKSDDAYQALFEVDLLDWSYSDYRFTDDGIRLVLADEQQLRFMDSADGTVLTHEMPETLGFSPYRVLGISPDASRIYWCSGLWDYDAFWITDSELWVTDLLTGQSRKVEMPSKPEEHITVADSVYTGESIVFVGLIHQQSSSMIGLFRWDLVSGSLEELYRYSLAPAENPKDEVEKYYWEAYQYRSLRLDETRQQISFATVTSGLDSPRHLIRLDLSGNETGRISPDFLPEPNEADLSQWKPYCYQWSPDGNLAAIGYGNYVSVIGPKGNLLFRVPAAGYDPMAWFLPDGNSLLVLTNDQILSQYRISDGACLAAINLNDHMATSVRVVEKVQLTAVDENTMVLFNGWDGFLLDISGDYIRVKALLDQGFCYDAGLDRFLVAESEHYNGRPATIGSFRRYTLEELLNKANAILDSRK